MGKQFEVITTPKLSGKAVVANGVRKIRPFLILSCLLILGAPVSSAGQADDMKFTRLSTKDGLSSNTVNTIIKDRTGMLWIATGQGLDKFDGENFKIYRFDSPFKAPFDAQDVKTLCLDNDGNLWAGVMGSGLFRYNRTTDKFERYAAPGLNGHIGNNYLGKIICDHENRLWLATMSGLVELDIKTKTVKIYKHNPKLPGSIGISGILTVFEDKKNRIWVGTTDGLCLLNRSNNTFSTWRHDDAVPTSPTGKDVNDIAEDENGTIWIATSNGLSKFNEVTNAFQNYRYNYKDDHSISANIVYRIVPQGDRLWLGTEGGLDEFDIRSGRVIRYNYDERNPYSITNKSIRNIYFDGQGTCWLSTFSSGVVKFDKNLTLFNVEQAHPHDPKGLSENFVNALQEYKNDEIFVGTDGGGLDLFHLKTRTFDHLQITSRLKVSKRVLPVLCMKIDHQKNLWIGTYQNGLFCYHPETKSYQQFTKGIAKGELSSNDIFCLNEDAEGKIWVGTNGDGIDIYDPKTGSFTKFNPAPASVADRKMRLNGVIRTIEFDKAGNVWVGTWGSGFGVYSPKSGKMRIYNPINTNLPIDKIISMTLNHDGNLWLGTNGSGLFYLDVNSEKIKAIKEDTTQCHEVVHKILEDNLGTIWYSTDKGLKSYDPITKRFAKYTQANGLQNTSFQNGSGVKTSSGTLFFGGSNGFNYFTAADVKRNTTIPPVVLTGLQLNNVTVTPGKNEPITEDISVAKVIHLDYRQSFSISYAALNYTLPSQNSYKVMLSGLDHSWNDVGSLKTAYYTNLDPGSYTFMVRAANNDGLWNNKGTSVKIIVSPPWWKTDFAYLCYLACLLTALWLMRRQGIKKIEMRQHEKQAEALHELDLMKIKFLTNLSHEFRTPISLILSPTEKLLSEYHDSALTSQLQVIRRNGKRLLNLVNQLLDFRKLEENELSLNVSTGEMVAFVKDLTESFRDLTASKKIDLTFNAPENKILSLFDPDKIERIIFNLLSNAFKFTPVGGRIAVELKEEQLGEKSSNIFISVSDNGIGIPDDKIELVFKRFYQTDELPSAINQGTGIGLSISKDLAEMHGGTLTVTSEKGGGSTFTLVIPVEKADEYHLEQAIALQQTNTEPIQKEPVEKESIAPAESELLHVLVIEDNEDFRHYLSNSLKPFYKVTEAEDGHAGWQKALSCHPDLIISDISMPHMDGISLSKKIKKDKRTNHIPIILLTALTGQANLLEGLETGASDYLTKPFDFEVLNLKIRNLLKLNKSLKDTYSKQLVVTRNDVEVESSSEKFLKNVVSYVEENMNNVRFSVDELSHHFNMSRGTLYYKILELTGLPPVEFMRTIKLDKAAIMLEKSDLSVSQIAYATGFATPHYFTKSFKAKFNVLPKDYRKKIKAEEHQEAEKIEEEYEELT